MADYDETTNPWPAIRELQDIVRDLNGDLKELRERVQVMEDSIKNVRLRIEVLEDFQVKQEGI